MDCPHFDKVGPVGVPISNGASKPVGDWRWIFCLACGAYKQWRYSEHPIDYTSDEYSGEIPWQLPKRLRKVS